MKHEFTEAQFDSLKFFLEGDKENLLISLPLSIRRRIPEWANKYGFDEADLIGILISTTLCFAHGSVDLTGCAPEDETFPIREDCLSVEKIKEYLRLISHEIRYFQDLMITDEATKYFESRFSYIKEDYGIDPLGWTDEDLKKDLETIGVDVRISGIAFVGSVLGLEMVDTEEIDPDKGPKINPLTVTVITHVSMNNLSTQS